MVLDFPNVSPSSESWVLMYNTQSFSSALTKTVQTAELDGAQWKATLSFSNLTPQKAALLRSFLAKMRGRAGRCWLKPNSKNLGAGGGDPRVNGAGQSGTSINVDGFAPLQSVILEGDKIEVDGELKVAVAQTDSDAAGLGVISFEPPLVREPTDGNEVRIDSPRCRMRLVNDSQANLALSVANVYNVTLQFEEDLF